MNGGHDGLYPLYLLRFTASYIRELPENVGWFLTSRQFALQLLRSVRA
nr:MAG TPA: hypothetical protein [Caudoviricetes sp.]